MTCLYVLLIFLRPQEFVEDIKGWPLVAYVAYSGLAVAFLDGSFRADSFKRSPVNLMVLFFWLALPLSQVARFWMEGATYAFTEFAKVAILYYMIVLTVNTWPRIKMFIWLLIICATFLAVQAIVQFHTGVGIGGGQALLRDQEILQARGIGIFADPNDLAIAILPMIAFVLPTFHKRFLSRTWVTGLFFLIPMVTGTIYTHSRGGMLGLASVGWYYLRRRVGKATSIVGLFLIMSLIMALPRMNEMGPDEESAHSRLEHWGYGMEQFKQHPIFGIGYEMFTEDYPNTAHNSFVLVLTEIGLLGAVLWVAMFYCTFRDLGLMREQWRGPPFLGVAAESMTAALMGWQVSAFFLSQTYKPLSFILMALVVSMQNALAREDIVLTRSWGLPEWGKSLGLTIAGIIFMHFLLKVLWAF